VAAIGMSFGANAGYAINPARDFGPRFFAWLAGWGQVAFPGVHGYFWVPIVGPLGAGRRSAGSASTRGRSPRPRCGSRPRGRRRRR